MYVKYRPYTVYIITQAVRIKCDLILGFLGSVVWEKPPYVHANANRSSCAQGFVGLVNNKVLIVSYPNSNSYNVY